MTSAATSTIRHLRPRSWPLLIAEPHHALQGVGLAMMLGGPALFLLGESAFVWRMIGTTNVTRVALAGVLILLVPIGGHVSALLVSLIVATLLSALAAWELRLRGREPLPRRAPAAGGHRRDVLPSQNLDTP